MHGSSPKAEIKRLRSGSCLRRQAKRRDTFLERKEEHTLKEVTTIRQDKNVSNERYFEQENLLVPADRLKRGRDSDHIVDLQCYNVEMSE